MCVARSPCDGGASERMSALGRSRQVRSQESGFHRCKARLAKPAVTTLPNGASTGQTARKTSPPTTSSTTSKRSGPAAARSRSLKSGRL